MKKNNNMKTISGNEEVLIPGVLLPRFLTNFDIFFDFSAWMRILKIRIRSTGQIPKAV
jgi:hypothetical protein